MRKLSSAAQRSTSDTVLLQGAFAGVFTQEKARTLAESWITGLDSLMPVTCLWHWHSARLALPAGHHLLNKKNFTVSSGNTARCVRADKFHKSSQALTNRHPLKHTFLLLWPTGGSPRSLLEPMWSHELPQASLSRLCSCSSPRRLALWQISKLISREQLIRDAETRGSAPSW